MKKKYLLKYINSLMKYILIYILIYIEFNLNDISSKKGSNR